MVVLAGAVDSSDDPALLTAVADARDAGYQTGVTDCHAGADVALGFSDRDIVYTVSVCLDSKEDADKAVAAFRERGVAGVAAEVQTYCLD